jgi:hypothetical protein
MEPRRLRLLRLFRFGVLGAMLLAVSVSAQNQTRRTTNVAALAAFPGYFHLRPITIVGAVSRTDNGDLRLADAPPSLHVVFTGTVPDGLSEIRGEFWDLGRMHSDDPRLATYDLKRIFRIDPDGAWPQPGQVTAIVANAIDKAQASMGTTIRSLVLYPSRYLDQKVTVVGQFAGRNLLGDLPDAPGRSQYDFVLRSADAAIWVTNLRPRGRDFDLSLDTRVDTGRWVELTGTLQQGRGLQWLNAEGSRIALASAPTEPAQATAQTPPPAPPPLQVVFSAPTEEETDVLQTSPVRIQFSRDLDSTTLKNHVQVNYLAKEAQDNGEPDTPIANFTVQYLPANRVLEIKFTDPLVRYRTIKVELLEGILGTDKQPLAPWTLTYHTGGGI